MIRVLLADDEPLLRAGVRTVLRTGQDIDVVAEAPDGRAALEQVYAHRPDVALLDIVMPVLDGLSTAAEINRTAPGTAVIMLTTFSEDDYIARALDAGANGFLLKTGDPRELLAGIRAVADGAAYLSPKIAKRVITELNTGAVGGRMLSAARARERVAALTDRERQVLALVGAGLPNAEIARRLYVTEGTVKVFMGSIMKRLVVRNRVQAAIIAYEAGLVADPDPPDR